MLIYVDKKKERQKKIKILCCIIVAVFIILANIVHFKTALHHSSQKLTDYHSIKFTNNWFEDTQPVYFFYSRRQNGKTIIVIPEKFNRENATTLAFALAKIPEKEISLYFTPEIKESNKIIQLANVFHSDIEPTKNANIIITTDLKNAIKSIPEEKLYPTLLHYKYTAKTPVNPALDNLLNDFFPPQPEPETTLKKEKMALKKFAEENTAVLKNLILKDKEPEFHLKNALLKNSNLCLVHKADIVCDLTSKNSLQKKLSKLQKKLPKNATPEKLLLLTSNSKVADTLSLTLDADDGLLFRYGKLKSFLLPNEWHTLTNLKEIPAKLKVKAGLNPNYTAPGMEFYRFKITEVVLDEEI